MTIDEDVQSQPVPARRGVIQRFGNLVDDYPSEIWALVASILVMWIGRGMVLPFLVIFFTQIVGLQGSTVGTSIAVASILGIIFSFVTAGQIDKRGGKSVLAIAMLSIGIATTLLAWAESPVVFVAFILLLYISSQSYWPSVDTVTSSIADPERVITSMSLVRVANALGIGIGGFIGGSMVAGGGLDQYRLMFMTGGALIITASILVWFIVPFKTTSSEDDDDGSTPQGSWGQVLADRTFLYSLVILFTMVLGFTQVQMSVPPFLRGEVELNERLIGGLFLLNTLGIILFQIPIAARVDRGNPGSLLPIGALLWAGAFGLMMLTVVNQYLALFVFLAFTAGELIYMPISAIFAVRLAPDRLRGRYFTLLSFTWGGAFAIATLAAGWIQDVDEPIVLWPVMTVLMMMAAIAALRLRRSTRLQPITQLNRQAGYPAGAQVPAAAAAAASAWLEDSEPVAYSEQSDAEPNEPGIPK